MTRIGITGRIAAGTLTFLIQLTTRPASRPATSPPRKPAPTWLAMLPPTKPATRPGRSAMPKAM